MTKVNDLLNSRFKNSSTNKASSLAEKTSDGNLSSFSGIFRTAPLSVQEELHLENLLLTYSSKKNTVAADLKSLSSITSEVKAINNQAAILHGERIKKAQDILKNYRDGAFSAWLVGVYGNRQTPYNFLQYFELYASISKFLQSKVDVMPRQAIYTLASRNCPKEQKEEIIQNYKGETKQELLALIRQKFPLSLKDKRASSKSSTILGQLLQVQKQLQNQPKKFSQTQKKQLLKVLNSIQKLI